MNPEVFIAQEVTKAIEALYNVTPDAALTQPQPTRKGFDGDFTIVAFALSKLSHKAPEATAQEIGEYLTANCKEISSFGIVKGFLNLKLSPAYWLETFARIYSCGSGYGQLPATGRTVMVEFSSPNTNKPLHLGHIRNNLLGWSVAKLMEANGHKVVKTNIVNDRGIHICKSMLAWQREAGGATPSSTGVKGDHFVGNYYVEFNNLLKEETDEILKRSKKEEDPDKEKLRVKAATAEAPIQREAQAMLKKWEEGDKATLDLWRTMNGWVYKGFDETYRRLGVSFDIIYYESDTYKLGKQLVMKGLDEGIFERHADGSVWCNLEKDGLDQKLLLRSDGTSVYMTQDLGTASERYKAYKFDEMIYVVGDEQNYHFQVLKLLLKKLGFGWADAVYHLSYGMVELPDGKMKSREGTVVDADDLMDEMFATAKATSKELGKLDGLSEAEQNELFETLGMGALKYFIIKVDPRKTMLFNPKESIDFNGNTGPFIQYTHARIKSVLRKAAEQGIKPEASAAQALEGALVDKEANIIRLLQAYPAKIREAGEAKSPALIANFCYELAKEFNQYYHDYSILREEAKAVRAERLALAETVARVLTHGMDILGIKLPERM